MKVVLKAKADTVIVRPLKVGGVTDSGIFIPQTTDLKYNRGEVLSKGKGTDVYQVDDIEIGEIVIYPKNAGIPISSQEIEPSAEKEEWLILRAGELRTSVEIIN